VTLGDKMMNRRRERQITIMGIGIVCLMLVMVVGQALLRISSGDFIGGKNYFEQPVGPILQLIVALVSLIGVAVLAWRLRHGEPKQSKKTDWRKPTWMKKPPYKFPWE